MRSGQSIGVVIPALNEERAIARVITDIPDWVDRIVVVDNGSDDLTAVKAMTAGASVVCEGERGYGAACLRGIKELEAVDIVVFLDGDYSDDPSQMAELVDPILGGGTDLVIGSRVLGRPDRGALLPQQRAGNWLACLLIRHLFGVRYTDLGPFRAIRFSSLQSLAMRDRTFGWTVEMQLKSALSGLNIVEVPVHYRPRIGTSKISGTAIGTLKAGIKILHVIASTAFRELRATQATLLQSKT